MGLMGIFAAAVMLAAQPIDPDLELEPKDFETTVFFDYGRNDLGTAGLLLVRERGTQALAAGFQKATVTGHTDKAGSEEQNLKSGLERAEAVREALIAAGFRPSDVVVTSAGETQPVRRHDDDRREPLNRRAVISFSSPEE